MKKTTLKTSLISSMALAAAVTASTVSAHDEPGSLTNGLLSGTDAGATDVYQIGCFQDPAQPSQNPTDHLFFQIRDDSPAGGPISATATVNGKAVTVTDTTPGDGIPSTGRKLKVTPAAQSVGFTVFVHHTAAAADNYLLSFHCEDAAGNHTGTIDPPTLSQNQ